MSLVWRPVSSDRGVLRHVVASPGDVIEVGDTLAVLTTTAEEDPAAGATGKFRVVTEPWPSREESQMSALARTCNGRRGDRR